MYSFINRSMRDEEVIRAIVKNASRGFKVLEVGSGGGRMAIEIAQRAGCTVYGIDSSNFAVAQARSRAMVKRISNRVMFLVQHAENLVFPQESFDLVYTVKTLHETRAPEALREMHRVLKNEGKIIIVDWVDGALTWTYERYFRPEELEDLVTRGGFKNIRIEVLNEILLLIAEKKK